MKQVQAAFINSAGVVFVQTEDGGLIPYIPLHPVAMMLDGMEKKHEGDALRAIILAD